MTVGIYTNPDRDIGCDRTKRFIALLRDRGMQYCVSDNVAEYIADDCYPLNYVAEHSDVLVVFGGDGTMLAIAGSTMNTGIPLLGINMGHLGFLTECEGDNLIDVVDRLERCDYDIEERSTLAVMYGEEEFTAVNEVSLSRGHTEHAIDIDIYVDGKMCDAVTGDGVIVCSPTGSTAYAMSCGGAILSPDLSAMQVTAICAHSLHSRPIVVSEDSVVTLRVSRAKRQAVTLTVDGRHSLCLGYGNSVSVTKGKDSLRLVRLTKDNFYSRLISKMNKWNNLDRRTDVCPEAQDR